MFYMMVLIFCHISFNQSFQQRAESKLAELIPDVKYLDYHLYKIGSELKTTAERMSRQRFFRPSLYTWKITTKNNIVKFAVLDNVIGKVQPITFLTIYSETGDIQFVEILKYREAYGYEIKRRSFRNQFIGKDNHSSYEIGSNIKNISGATISVRSLTKGVQKLSFLFDSIKASHARLSLTSSSR